ncbi:MAG: hypothetical protein JZU53_06805 [Paludibacter sp.]|nr:hypothetical protein [Paludibacter sp.]
MNEYFRLDDREFDLWQSKFISYVEHKCREWAVSVDKVQVLIIYQSKWGDIFESTLQDKDQYDAVIRFVERSKYQKMIEKFVLCLIDTNKSAKSDLDIKIVEWIEEAITEARLLAEI